MTEREPADLRYRGHRDGAPRRTGHRETSSASTSRSSARRPGSSRSTRLHEHRRRLRVGDHLHRRRQGHPALPRHPDRAARRADTCRRSSRRRTCSSTATCRPAASSTSSATASAHTLLHEDMKRFFDGFPKDAHPMAILSSMVSALSTFYPDSDRPARPRAGAALDHPPDGEGADDRGVLVQEVDRPAVRLPEELARPHRELPHHDVRGAGRAVRGQPGRSCT